MDRPSAALIRDLKLRGLLDDTLVIWGGEFGRTPMNQGDMGNGNYGRDHHMKAFTIWMAGGGIKPGMGISLTTAPLARDTEVTGPLAAVLWVASSTEDMDLSLTLRNFDPEGNEVLETGQPRTPMPVAKGWLRVSHRKLDEKRRALLSLWRRGIDGEEGPSDPEAVPGGPPVAGDGSS